MKRLILDCFRRRAWILALGAVLEFVIGWATASSADKNMFHSVSFFQFQITLFTGPLLLSFDLNRGIVRAITALPLTARQIGRSWWLATVGIPAIVLAAPLFLGVGASCLLHPNMAFPADWLAISSIFILLWLGTGYTLICSTPLSFNGNWWRLTRYNVVGALWGLVIFGSLWFFQDVSNSPFKLAAFIGVGTVLTAVGWFRAEQFVLGRAGFRLAALQSRNSRGQHRAPDGYGGIPLLISSTFVRLFLIGLAMVAAMSLTMAWQGHMKSWHQVMESMAKTGSFFPFWFVIFFQLVPVLLQLRFLRTLPIPATSLAAVMIAVAILPLIALGALVAGIAGLTLGTPAAAAVLKSYMLTVASASLCVFFAVWQGVGMKTYALLIIAMIGTGILPLWLRQISFSLTATIIGICVAFALLVTRCTIIRSSAAYRVRANPFGFAAWGTGR